MLPYLRNVTDYLLAQVSTDGRAGPRHSFQVVHGGGHHVDSVFAGLRLVAVEEAD